MLSFLKNKQFLTFLVKFILVYVVCYYGTLAVIGLSAEGGHYSPFVSKYLNYIDWMRSVLLYTCKFVLKIFGIETYLANQYYLKMVNGRGIILVYECIGYGVMSFWTAFVVASMGSFRKKLLWWLGGIAIFFVLNITRLCLLLVATNKNWAFPFGWDHHIWFNTIAYIAMLLLIFYFDRKNSDNETNAGKLNIYAR